MNRLKYFTTLCVTALTAAITSIAQAAYPERPITLIVPWSAGGGTDAVARTIGVELEKELKQPINIVNRTGGSGVVGHQAIASANPDGYTIGIITVEITQLHYLGLTKLNYKDYTPLALVNFDPNAIFVRSDSPIKSADKLIAAAKANPGKIKASGTGQGGIWHLGLARWLVDNKLPGNAIAWVPSNGAAPGLQDLLAGGVDVASCSLPEARALLDANRIQALTLMSSKHDNIFPNVPLYKDASGQHWNAGAWRGIAAPKGLPKEATDRLSAALKKVYDGKSYQDFLAARGFGSLWADSSEFEAFMSKGDAEMSIVMKAAGLAK